MRIDNENNNKKRDKKQSLKIFIDKINESTTYYEGNL